MTVATTFLDGSVRTGTHPYEIRTPLPGQQLVRVCCPLPWDDNIHQLDYVTETLLVLDVARSTEPGLHRREVSAYRRLAMAVLAVEDVRSANAARATGERRVSDAPQQAALARAAEKHTEALVELLVGVAP